MISPDAIITEKERIIMQLKLSYIGFYPSFWCYVHPSSVPLGAKAADFILVVVDVRANCQHLESFAGRL